MRTFPTGATRDSDENKPDYEGFLSPLVITRFGDYMHKHRRQPDGTIRDSDNWQRGIPLDAFMKSGYRHFISWWRDHRAWRRFTHGSVLVGSSADELEDTLCALLFNVQGYLHEHLKEKDAPPTPRGGLDGSPLMPKNY